MSTNTLSHRGYTGTLAVDTESGTLCGEVLGIRDVVTFEGKTVPEARQAFIDSVDDYLAFCEESGHEPDRPYSGRFNVRMSAELHRELDMLARVNGYSLNEAVKVAVRREINRQSGAANKQTAGGNESH